MSEKTLIISASTGSGHIRAAEAIKKRLEKKKQQVEHIDMINYVSLPMKTAVVSSYTLLANKLPELWGFLYKKSDNKNLKNRFNQLTKKLKEINSNKLYKYIDKYNPDKIICTHFLPADLLTNKSDILNNCILELQITDYGLHELWVIKGMDKYYVATKKIKNKLIKKGIDNEKIIVKNIPVDPTFQEGYNQIKIKKDLNLNPKWNTILVLSGGQGLGQILKIVDLVIKNEKDINLIAIAGKNKKLETKLKQKSSSENINYNPIGWTDKIDKYMKASDVIISKPGGMTTSECIATQKPMLVVNPIPGQEEANAEYIVNNNYGYLVNNIKDIPYYIEKTQIDLST